MMGRHPTQHTLCSAHVWPFSKRDTIAFLDAFFPEGFKLVDFRGAPFYPFPGKLAQVLASTFPTFALTISFLTQKYANTKVNLRDIRPTLNRRRTSGLETSSRDFNTGSPTLSLNIGSTRLLPSNKV